MSQLQRSSFEKNLNKSQSHDQRSGIASIELTSLVLVHTAFTQQPTRHAPETILRQLRNLFSVRCSQLQ
jgi:hypothetical protein